MRGWKCMGEIIIYERSDVLQVKSGRIAIAHVVNDLGVMGAGIALQIRQRWPRVYDEYHELVQIYGHSAPSILGRVQDVRVSNDPPTVILNCFAQRGIRRNGHHQPFDLAKFQACMFNASEYAQLYGFFLHMPYGIGAGLAGGKWSEIEQVIRDVC